MYLGEATIQQDRINEIMDVVLDLEVKELSKDDGTNSELVNTGEEQGLDIPEAESFNNDSSMHDDQNRSVSDTIDELLNLDIPEYNASKELLNTYESLNCQDCETVFTTKRNLQHHNRSKHEGLSYSCNHCQYKATIHSDLRKHQQYKHEGVKYSCNQCDYQAGHKTNLKRHKSTKHSLVEH